MIVEPGVLGRNWGVVQERPDGTFRPMSMSETLALNQGRLFPKQSLLDEL